MKFNKLGLIGGACSLLLGFAVTDVQGAMYQEEISPSPAAQSSPVGGSGSITYTITFSDASGNYVAGSDWTSDNTLTSGSPDYYDLTKIAHPANLSVAIDWAHTTMPLGAGQTYHSGTAYQVQVDYTVVAGTVGQTTYVNFEVGAMDPVGNPYDVSATAHVTIAPVPEPTTLVAGAGAVLFALSTLARRNRR